MHLVRLLTAPMLLAALALAACAPIQPQSALSGAAPGETAPAETVPAPPDDPAAAAAVAEAALLAWGITPPPANQIGIDSAFAFPVSAPGGETLWVAHTGGLRDMLAGQAHMIGLFRSAGDAWEEVAHWQFEDDADAMVGGPDFLTEGTVKGVNISPDRIWLAVSGGVGAHSGVFFVLSVDETGFSQEAAGFSSSPGAAEVRDLDGDGWGEVVLDATEYYVFCYACGVRLYNYSVLRWDGAQMVPVVPAELGGDAPAELVELNNRAVELAKAGLYKDALAVVDNMEALGVDDPTAAWNARLIRLTGERRAEQPSGNSAYPLLEHIFYGDYDAAVDIMREYPVEQVFTYGSPLIVGTVAEGWEGVLMGWIDSAVEPALEAEPDLAPAYFMRGWRYFIEGNVDRALEEVSRAAELAPDDAFFVESAAFLETAPKPKG